jgi:hypothetical protein
VIKSKKQIKFVIFRYLLTEIGPFVYKEVIVKDAIVDNLNYTTTYKERKMYFFLPDLSPYPDDYPITTINIAPVALIYSIRHLPTLGRDFINVILKITGETLVITKPAKDLLFGYKDNFLSLIKEVPILKNFVPSEYVGLFYGVFYCIVDMN